MTEKAPNFIDMTGMQYGRWVVLERDMTSSPKALKWICKCSCKKETVKSVYGYNLRAGISKSCGCWNLERDRTYERPGLIKDLTNQKFGLLTVIEKDEDRTSGAVHWYCRCDCGGSKIVDGRLLRNGSAQSCGCLISSGEEKIRRILNENNITFKSQFQFLDLPNRQFDFAVFNNSNLIFLIEFDGEQHFNKESLFYSKEGIKRDKEKNRYCLLNGLYLYRIPYWDKNKLENLSSLTKDEYLVKEGD